MHSCGTSVRSCPANAASKMENFEQILKDRLAAIHTLAPGSIGSQMQYELLSCDEDGFKCLF